MARMNKNEEPNVEVAVKETKPVKKANKKGVVADCELLNVRSAASTTADVVKTIPVGSEVEILGSEADFYKISGGFVMKQFIKL